MGNPCPTAVRRRRWERRETALLPCVRTGGDKDKNRIVSFKVAVLKICPLLIYSRSRSRIAPFAYITRAFCDPRSFLCSSCERKAEAPECTEAFERPRTESEPKLNLGAKRPNTFAVDPARTLSKPFQNSICAHEWWCLYNSLDGHSEIIVRGATVLW